MLLMASVFTPVLPYFLSFAAGAMICVVGRRLMGHNETRFKIPIAVKIDNEDYVIMVEQ